MISYCSLATDYCTLYLNKHKFKNSTLVPAIGIAKSPLIPGRVTVEKPGDPIGRDMFQLAYCAMNYVLPTTA